MTEEEKPTSPEEKIEYHREFLREIEEKRVAVSGELAERNEAMVGYKNVAREAEKAYEDASNDYEKHKETPHKTEFAQAAAGYALIVAGSYQSLAKHMDQDDISKDRVLDLSLDWLKQIEEKYLDELRRVNRTLHGPMAWEVELFRNKARAHERMTLKRDTQLRNAIDYYKKAVDSGRQIISGAEESQNTDFLVGAKSATGVAMGELAKAIDTLAHEEGLPTDEESILNLLAEGRGLVWETKDQAPDYDRLETVEGWVLTYLNENNYSSNHEVYRQTMEHLKILAEENDLVRGRIARRIELGQIPEKYLGWFEGA